MLSKKIYISFLIFLFCNSIISLGQVSPKDTLSAPTKIDLPDYDESTTIFQKIKQDSFFEVVLQTNFDSLIKNKRVSKKRYPGTILFKNHLGEQFKMKVKIEPRGRSRRSVCSMPPLKIDFPKQALEQLGLYPGCDKLKLVTNCNDTENSDQVLIKEYWIYNLYNYITPQSFQVFNVKITYVNTNDPTERFERFAFFIESNEGLALRLDGEIVDLFGTTPEKIEPTSYHNTLMFQFMIGNLDWDMKVNRNIKLIKQKTSDRYLLVPYDFDYSGLVKAPHARLNPDFNQKNIEERFPQGKFSSKAALRSTAELFLAHRKEGFRCFMSCPILNKGVKKKMNKYLGSFYSILKDKEELESLFLK